MGVRGMSLGALLSGQMSCVNKLGQQDTHQNPVVSHHAVPVLAVQGLAWGKLCFSLWCRIPTADMAASVSLEIPLTSSLVCGREKCALCCVGFMEKLLM